MIQISTDKSRLDVAMIHEYLSERSYWARGRSREQVEKSIANSLCFGAYLDAKQLGFARVVTDCAVFGWVADVFVLEEYRGQSIGKMLVEALVNHPDIVGLRRLGLGTVDAHELYRQYGFSELNEPGHIMERTNIKY